MAADHAQTDILFEAGTLRLTTPWGSAAGQILVNDESVPGPWATDGQDAWTCRYGPWELRLRSGRATGVTLTLANRGPTAARLRTVHLGRWNPAAFRPGLRAPDFRELIMGGSFRSLSSGVKGVGRRAPGLDFVVPSSLFTVYQHDDGQALLLGALPPLGDSFAEFASLHAEAHLEGEFGFEVRHTFECVLPPGASVRTSPLVALQGADGTRLMQLYGSLWRERLRRPAPKPPVVGWNSWDYYSGAVDREAMDDNLAAASELCGSAVGTLVIDEGWETQWGTWEPNRKFGDLAAFCRHVRAHGGTPGIWTAPLLVNTYNPLFLARPEWFAARTDGQLQTDSYAYGPMAYLDVTRDDVLAHLSDLFRRLRETGFGYFKVDFSHCLLNASRFHNPAIARNALLRRAFQAIREAIGQDAYLLSCGTPYESVAGLVDAVRTTGDIHIYWGHVLVNAANLATKWWMQGNLWNGDPDFLVVRGPDTAEPPYGRRRVVTPLPPDGGWLAGVEFSEMEARTWALLVHLSGGDVVLGDRLRALRPNGLAMVKRVLRPRTPAAVPVDLFTTEQHLPRVWVSRGEHDTLVGLINWTDKPARLEFDPARLGLAGTPSDFWTGLPVPTLPQRQPRRSSLALLYPGSRQQPVEV